LINCWLLLRDAGIDERKSDLARFYIQEHLPEIHRAVEAISTADGTPLQVSASILD
jgi:hypothetical protein